MTARVASSPQGGSRTAAVMNPRSAGGRTGRTWNRIRTELEAACGPVTVFATEAPGHGIRLTADAIRSGFSRILAVGGDGTLSEVVNGVMSVASGSETEVGLIPQGTGSDFRRTLGLPLDRAEAIRTIRDGRIARIDLMRVAYTARDGAPATRYAMNLTSFGMGGLVASRANRSSKPLGGTVTFLCATALTAFGYRGDRVSIELDGVTIPDVRITNVAVGNGQYHGSGMWICPGAAIDDGLLDVTLVEKLSLWRLLTGSRYLFNGRISDHPKVRGFRTSNFAARTLEGASAVEIDGEPVGYLPIRIEIVPGALRMIVP